MLFSIIIPVYNVANYLEACVNSVLANDFTDWEAILVDDGSTDGICPALCDRLAERDPHRIRVIHQENMGLGGARNTGLEAAQGQYLLFLDSDDTITPDALEILRQALSRHNNPEVVVFHARLVPEDGSQITYQRHCLPADICSTLPQNPTMLLDPPMTCARLWSRELFLRSGIRFPIRLLYEDLCTTPKLLLAARSIVGIDQAIYNYLQRSGSIMRGKDPRRNQEIMTVLDSVYSWFKTEGQFDCYYQELCGMGIAHIYYACYRVLRLDPGHALIKKLVEYLTEYFPDYTQCKYYCQTLSRMQRMVFALMRHGHNRLAYSLFQVNDRLHLNRRKPV